MSGNCDVLDNTDLLEKIIVCVPHEFIFNCILVSKRWFGLISDSSFLEHYIKRWSDEVNVMRCQLDPKPSAEGNELQRGLQCQQLAALDQLQHRLQSQQLAALDQLQHRVALHHPTYTSMVYFGYLNMWLHDLHHDREVALSEFHRKLQSPAEIHDMIWDAQLQLARWTIVNNSQQEKQSKVLGAVKGLLKVLPCHRWAAVNEVQHRIVCELLVAVNEAQRQRYWDLISKPYNRFLTYELQKRRSETSVAPSTTTPGT